MTTAPAQVRMPQPRHVNAERLPCGCSAHPHEGSGMAHTSKSATIKQIFDQVTADFRREGHQQGREEVLRANLLMVLERRFGRLPDPALVRIYRAGSEAFREWLARASTADTLWTVFGDRDPDTRTPTAAEQLQAEGRPGGLLEGQRESVTLLLSGRFGHLPEHLRDRIWGADLGPLQRWFERGFTAPSLDAVFENEPRA
jgi:hypothetical protein